MTCSYCGTRNNAGEHRCRKCGRRPDDTLTGEFTLHPINGALAAKPQRVPSAKAEDRQGEQHQPELQEPVQGSLFQVSKVVPIQSYAPHLAQRRSPAQPAAAAAAAAATPARPVAKPKAPVQTREEAPKATIKQQVRRTRPSTGQEQLDFLPPAPPKPKTLGTTVEATIWCDYPVATQMHRAIAMAVDWSMVMIGYALCLAVYKLLGGSFVLNKPGLIATGGMLAVVATAYFLIWAIMNTETAGMRSMQLELVTFDGSPLEPSQRWLRYFGSCLSSLTLLGHIWSLLDEEGLAWQDHMSRTFPRPLGARAQVFRRK